MMGKCFIAGFILLLAGFACLAQSPILAFPPGTFQNRAVIDGGAIPFAGALNTVSGAKYGGGLDPPTLAFSGAVYKVCDVPTGLICADATAAAGVVTLPLLGGLACGVGVTCNVDTLYDTSGASSCGGACDLTQSTNSKRPILVVGSPNYLTFDGTSQTLCKMGGTYTLTTQPLTTSIVYRQPAAGSDDIFAHSAVDIEIAEGTNTVLIYAGSSFSRAATNNTWFALQAVFNGASSSINNGATTTGNAGTNFPANDNICIGSFDEVSFFSAIHFREVWGYDIAFNGTQVSNMIANQSLRGGF